MKKIARILFVGVVLFLFSSSVYVFASGQTPSERAQCKRDCTKEKRACFSQCQGKSVCLQKCVILSKKCISECAK
jgi:hypothetical protein